METWQIVVLTVVGLIVVKFLVLLIVVKGNLAQLGLACKVFFRVVGDSAFAAKVPPLFLPPEPPKPPRKSAKPLHLLTLLQHKGASSTSSWRTSPPPPTTRSAPACASCTARPRP